LTNITKHDLVNEVSRSTGLTQVDTKVAVEEFLLRVQALLSSGQTIEVRGFGTFYTKKRKPRPARNPKTGQVVPLYERIVPLFKFSSDIKKRINELSLVTVEKKKPVAAKPSVTVKPVVSQNTPAAEAQY
jgi:integration host factor subunit beta